MSRSITLNGVKATIIFHDTTSDNPADKPTINWELVIETGDNKAMIDGSISMEVRFFDPEHTVTMATTATTATATTATATATTATTDDTESLPEETPTLTREQTQQDFNDRIRKYLSEIASTKNRKEKADIATVMFKHMTDATQFVENQQEFKKTAIDRAYYLKVNENADELSELMEAIDAFLVTVRAPLEIPSEYIKQDDRKYEEDRKYEQDEYIEECVYRWPKFVGNVDKHKDDHERIVMLKKLFEEENLTFKIEYMNWYYDWEETAPKLNRYQKMKAFIDANKHALMDLEDKENDERKKLMVSIFKKKNIEFKDVYMDMYYEWGKNAPKENRYKKMCSFIDVQGFK